MEMRSRTREITVYNHPTGQLIRVEINPDELTGEAWRLARCLTTTNLRTSDNGVRVQSLKTNAELARAEGWQNQRAGDETPEETEARVRRAFGDWVDQHQVIDWQFRAMHYRGDPADSEMLHLKVLAYLQSEAERITEAGGTVIASGDWGVRLLPEGYGEEIVLIPDEEAEVRLEQIDRALFGGSD